MSTPPPELEVLQGQEMPDPGPSPPSTPRRTPPPPPLGLFPAAGLLKDPMRDARERRMGACEMLMRPFVGICQPRVLTQ
ncbi:hypothetical protein V496_02422 [Pseudogymnoascus sp. VKM F-4515 (FW-2607)]|nr:hypothetical protein V496_02422 [Pseudogymnoascus sp. VKM F-4515 (FW-2607)]